MNLIKIKIEYYGHFRKITGNKTEILEVPYYLESAYELIRNYLLFKYNIVPPYILMVNGIHIISALKKDKNKLLKENDIFHVMPSTSGG